MGCIEKFMIDGKIVEKDCHSGNSVDYSANKGPGTELKNILKKLGIEAESGCACNSRAKLMDAKEQSEPGWCSQNINTIVGWLREEANKRGLPFIDIAGKILVKRAISNYEKNRSRENK